MDDIWQPLTDDELHDICEEIMDFVDDEIDPEPLHVLIRKLQQEIEWWKTHSCSLNHCCLHGNWTECFCPKDEKEA